MAASMSSRSNATIATIRSSASISTIAEYFGVERLGPPVSARVEGTNEGEAIPADREDV